MLIIRQLKNGKYPFNGRLCFSGITRGISKDINNNYDAMVIS